MPTAVPGLLTRIPDLPDAPGDLSGWYAMLDRDGEPTSRRVLATSLASGGEPEGMVKTDGSTPFTQPQTGVAATAGTHLVTKNQLDPVANSAAAAATAAGDAQADADAALAVATTADGNATSAAAAAAAAATTANAALPRAGGTMTGAIVLSGAATAAGHPVRKTEFDTTAATATTAGTNATTALANAATADGKAVAAQATADAALPRAGGTMTGAIVLAGAATLGTHPVRKTEFDTTATTATNAATAAATADGKAVAAQTTADAALPRAGGTMTGAIVLSGAATLGTHPVRKTESDVIAAKAAAAVSWPIQAILPPTTLPAARLYGTSSSTPQENYPFWSFIAGAVSYLDLYTRAPADYPGSGVNLDLWFIGVTGVAGNMQFAAAGRRLAGGSIAGTLAYSFSTTTNIAAPTIDVPVNGIIAVTHAQLNSPAAGDPVLIRLRRDGATDAIAQACALLAFAIKVTSQ